MQIICRLYANARLSYIRDWSILGLWYPRGPGTHTCGYQGTTIHTFPALLYSRKIYLGSPLVVHGTVFLSFYSCIQFHYVDKSWFIQQCPVKCVSCVYTNNSVVN
jgi:hypothetical protein